MKKITLFLFTIISLMSYKSFSQCTDFSSGGPWNDFNTEFGGAPCDDGSGCPLNEITAFQIWADESYLMNGVVAGHTYTFSACNGVGGTAWDISYTIIAPSGAIDAFGLDGGSICAITWTATESGVYEIGISEAGVACDSSTNTGTNNGFPAITCSGTAPCPSAPDPVTTPTPADLAVDVYVDPTDDEMLVAFDWEPAVTGGAVTEYDVYLGDSALNLVLLGSTPNDFVNITAMEYSTTYFWQIVATNSTGDAVGSSIWSFTTEADPNLSVDEFENKAFTHFYNKDSDVLTITSSTLAFENIEIYNLLGQQVVNKISSQTTETVDMSSLEDGVYLAKVTIEGRTQTVKILKN